MLRELKSLSDIDGDSGWVSKQSAETRKLSCYDSAHGVAALLGGFRRVQVFHAGNQLRGAVRLPLHHSPSGQQHRHRHHRRRDRRGPNRH